MRASRDIDGKSVFAISGRGTGSRLTVNAVDGLLGNSRFDSTDRAAAVCPVGVILPKHHGYDTPMGRRRFDLHPLDEALPEQGDGE